MKDDEEFKKALADKQMPILVLDVKWHRLFAVHGKPDEIHETENELNALLARQGKLNEELKQLKKVKKQLMESIVANMDGTTSEDMDAQREKKLDEDKRLIDETNQHKFRYCSFLASVFQHYEQSHALRYLIQLPLLLLHALLGIQLFSVR